MTDEEVKAEFAQHEAKSRAAYECRVRAGEFLDRLIKENGREPTEKELPEALKDVLGAFIGDEENQRIWLNAKNEELWGDQTPQQIIDEGMGSAILRAFHGYMLGIPN